MVVGGGGWVVGGGGWVVGEKSEPALSRLRKKVVPKIFFVVTSTPKKNL